MHHIPRRQVPRGPCPLSCPGRFPHQPGSWCAACLHEHDRWLEEQAAPARLSRAHADRDRVLPATHSERVAYLDSITPRSSWREGTDAP